MAKTFIKLNNNDYHLSIGNLFRIIKEMASNKTAALQSELFCILFSIKDINDTTVNNYCVGARSIGDTYKQIFFAQQLRRTDYPDEKEGGHAGSKRRRSWLNVRICREIRRAFSSV